MSPKMLVLDLDNTLLRSDKTVSDYTRAVLARCRRRGILIVPATARPLRTVAPMLRGIECDAMAYHNGAVVTAGARPVGTPRLIPAADALRILTALRDRYPHMPLSVEMNERLYANFDVTTLWDYTQATATDFTDLPRLPAEKIIARTACPEEHRAILELLTPQLYAQRCDGCLCLVMNRGATKLTALLTLSAHFGIGLEQMTAFGDDVNDIDMIRACGTGVAVRNALAEVKLAADAVTGSNDEDGVARYIDRVVLGGYAG